MQKSNVYAIVTDRIIQQLQKGIIPWRQTWSNKGAICNLISKKPYNGFNSMLLAAGAYSQPWFLTFKQCYALGGTIRSGEHGWPVIFWKRSYQLNDGSYSDGKTLTPAQRLTSQVSYLLRYYRVWNVTQCDGIDSHIPPLSTVIHNPIQEAEAIIRGYKTSPPIKRGGNQAFYSPNLDFVQMPVQDAFESSAAYYTVLFHELTHSTGHSKRLNRKEVANATIQFASCDYSKEELVAEMGACFLSNHAGILFESTIQNSASYIQSWISKLQNEPMMLVNASAKAQAAANYILNITTTMPEQ